MPLQALHEMGLRVVQDVVYNHTFASGLDRYSVLDKVVPGYYHRRMENGDVCNSTCCNNTATEHYMAGRHASAARSVVCMAIDACGQGRAFPYLQAIVSHLHTVQILVRDAYRLMIDDLVHWATHYRIDGFRCLLPTALR